ncbi:MAG: penicillin-binding protein 2 [Candidatus Omnitrophica bacterium]|nr:penicillin-binding protein 2 [Candidatus Omnitrophota bacterium]
MQTSFRFLILKALIYSGFVFLSFGLFNAQVIEGRRYRKLSEQNRIRLIPLEAPRGRVFDKNGHLLATNRPSYDVVATPEDVTPEVFSRLSKLLKMPEKKVRERMSGPREYPFAPVIIQEDISRDLVFQIEQYRPELPGVEIRVSFLRYYPYGETASHIIGYIGKIGPDEYQKLQRDRYGLNSFVGRFGIEKIFDERLRGWRGGRQIEVNAYGQLMKVLSQKDPEHGQDLHLTLDLDFQQRVMQLIEGKRASVAVLNLKTDGLIVLASSPAFDPNVFVNPGLGEARLEFLKDPESPLLDRGVSSAYPPGSVFKLVTALAALQTGKINPQTRFFCPGYFQLKSGSRPYHCWKEGGHGSLNLYQAIERSCNVYFYNLGARLSPEEISQYARELGLGERMQLETSNIAPGLVPDAAWKRTKYHDKWYQGETLSFAIGQSYLLTSPIQVLRLVSIIAKDGLMVEPHLLEEENASPAAKQHVAINEENLKTIKRAMLQVVQSDYGTGQFARLSFEKMAAKTGTAQVPPRKAHSWMSGFFPYQNPEVAFVVFVEHGGPGGLTSAHIVKKMFEIWRDMNAQKVA